MGVVFLVALHWNRLGQGENWVGVRGLDKEVNEGYKFGIGCFAWESNTFAEIVIIIFRNWQFLGGAGFWGYETLKCQAIKDIESKYIHIAGFVVNECQLVK